MSIEAGVLYVVATPIGNLQDLSPRAQETLRGVKRIAAEDTRHSLPLLCHFGVHAPAQSLHEHNERQSIPDLLQRLSDGDSVALISDAGTPLISDPGVRLVEAAHQAGIRVIPIPGPSAVATALSAAGMAADSFVFVGFLPPKPAARRKRLESLKSENRTLVLYEAPHRIEECLEDLRQVFGGERVAVLCKELSKIHETVYRAPLAELCAWITAKAERQRGEFVLVIQGAAETITEGCSPEAERILRVLTAELPLAQAARLAAQITGVGRKILYEQGLSFNAEDARDE
jgi:16S rRNA (cytidine1402-2'-O)-methyltransferase